MTEAEKNLRENQRQLDQDGVMVGVSRQAIDEVLAEIETLRNALKNLLRVIETDDLIPESVSYMREARAALQPEK